MTLRARLSLLVVALVTAVAVAFGAATWIGFVRQQDAQLRALLEQDLARVAALLDRPVLGASFGASESEGFVLQFVDAGGEVALAWGGDAPLPLAAEPRRVRLDGAEGEPYLVGSAPWRATGGTIRLAHPVGDALAVRATLARSLTVGGVLAALLASLGGLIVTRRALGPLTRLAGAARAVDPAAPESAAAAVRAAETRTAGEVRDLADALADALGQIARRKERERAFLLEVGHELAAPLTLVDHHVMAARSANPGDPDLRAAASAARELKHTSRDLLAVARGELERPLELRIVDLRELVTGVAESYPGVRVSLGPSDAVEVVADPDRLRQVLRNLIRNGVQAAGGAERVELRLRAEPGAAIVEVRDEGPGMAPEDAARVFERGFTRGRGLGVGLTLSREIVERHGGEIDVRSAPGEGSVFAVRLPDLVSQLEGDDAQAAPGTSASPVEGS